jgi:hypothetical protein
MEESMPESKIMLMSQMHYIEIEHEVGDPSCGECWDGYPKPCDCGGLIHAQNSGEGFDCIQLNLMCDDCGKSKTIIL